MGLPEVSLGVIRLRRNTTFTTDRKGRAMEMIMTAGMVTAQDAYRTGLVNHVVPEGELLDYNKSSQ
jgi:enoyl-CoA hydratase